MSISQSTIPVIVTPCDSSDGGNLSQPLSVEQFIIRNEDSMVLTMVSYGATITSCLVGGGDRGNDDDKDSCAKESLEEVALCYPLERLVNEPGPYFGTLNATQLITSFFIYYYYYLVTIYCIYFKI